MGEDPSWQSAVNDACQPDLHKSLCTFGWRTKRKWKYVIQLPVQGDQSLGTGRCASQWLKGHRSIPEVQKVLQAETGCRPEHQRPWTNHEGVQQGGDLGTLGGFGTISHRSVYVFTVVNPFTQKKNR